MQNRIKSEFENLKAAGRGGFIPFIVAGDPDLETSKRLIVEIGKRGANVIELGVPFSDPVADGPTIQAASERALKNPISIEAILNIVAEARAEGLETPLILFSYFNPILQFGLERFADEALKSGVDGVLITDLVPEEAAEFKSILDVRGLSLIMLAAPTSSDERLRKICAAASGFIYAVSRAGVTGTRDALSVDAEVLVGRLRKFTDLPIAVGFGISTAKQVEETWRYADAAVVGSAIVAEIAADSGEDAVEKIGEFVSTLRPQN
ncbi:MAG: tryptophan synthase subunit alpha [Acidobacteria bacterium]|nr:tryptophan synthase subunit alpha [Acidobacteriota bacterium]